MRILAQSPAQLLSRLIVALTIAWAACSSLPQNSSARGSEPSFLRDVMPALSKAGCNLGTCHGNAFGKGGLKLSLRGVDPQADFHALTREHAGRRVDLFAPEQSLILRKATMQLAHQGGKRFDAASPEYKILHAWLAAAAPPPQSQEPTLIGLEVSPPSAVVAEPTTSIQLRVSAKFSDGEVRDVSRLAVYEPSTNSAVVEPAGRVQSHAPGEVTVLVRYLAEQVPVTLAFIPAREDYVWHAAPAQNYIDRHVDKKLQSLRMNSSALADDAMFIRRAYLDTLGLLPTPEAVRKFLNDSRADKRARLIDELLVRPEFAEVWALRWADLLRAEEKVLDAKGVERYHGWMQKSFAQNKPLNEFVHELLTARGSTYENPPANYWRSMRDPITRAESTAQLFLGTRLGCAKCHTHPFDRWTQDDYYSWAALFARIDYKVMKNDRKDKLDKNEFVGEQIVLLKRDGELKNAATNENAAPRFLGASKRSFSPEEDRLLPLADWLTSPDNRQFARMQTNRVWFYLMGRGIVEPIDDFRATNPPSNAALLEALTDDFIASGYDVQKLVRTVMNSRTYQLSSVPNETNADDEANFARATLRRLTAEQLLDAQSDILDVPADFKDYPRGTRAGQIAGVSRLRSRHETPADGDRFLRLFGKPERLLTCECERSSETTLHQALTLVAGSDLQQRIAAPTGRLERLANSQQSNEEIVAELYWLALSRPPTSLENNAALKLFEASPDRRAALEDLTWALFNASEFLLRR